MTPKEAVLLPLPWPVLTISSGLSRRVEPRLSRSSRGSLTSLMLSPIPKVGRPNVVTPQLPGADPDGPQCSMRSLCASGRLCGLRSRHPPPLDEIHKRLGPQLLQPQTP